MEKSLINVLNENGSKLSKRQRTVAKYITDNYESAAFMTAERLAEATGVSESTVVRFACDLGYGGYPGLRRAMQELLRQRMNSDRAEKESRRVDCVELLRNQAEKDIRAIRALSDDLNAASFPKAMELLFQAKKIYFCADSSVMTLSAHTASMLRALQPKAEIVCLNEEYTRLLGSNSESVLVYFGADNVYDKTPVSLRMAKDGGAKIITVTSGADAPACRCADVKLIAETCTSLVTVAYAIVACFEKVYDRTLEHSVRQMEQLRLEYSNEKD